MHVVQQKTKWLDSPMDLTYPTGKDYINFLVPAAERRTVRHVERFGQAFFNVLHLGTPAIANAIRSTPYDPFFNNYVTEETKQRVIELYDQMINEAA